MSEQLTAYLAMADMLDAVPSVLYCVKDVDGRYLAVNNAFVERTGRSSRRDVVGRLAVDCFPADLAARYAEQDRECLALGSPLRDEVELIPDAQGQPAWFLTTKQPVFSDGTLVGLAVVSSAIPTPPKVDREHPLRPVVAYIREHLAESMTVEQLSAHSGLTLRQFERLMRRTFGLPTKQYLTQCRVIAAGELLRAGEASLAEIAVACGWYDQSAFSRQFTRITGVTPGEFRRKSQRGNG